jgi:hypothetical protein
VLNAGTVKPEIVSALAKVERADFRRNFQMNVSVGHDDRGELQAHAEFLERNRDRRKSGARLHDGERELAAGQEAGFLAVDRDQVGLGQNLQQVLGLQRFDDRAEINIGPERETGSERC